MMNLWGESIVETNGTQAEGGTGAPSLSSSSAFSSSSFTSSVLSTSAPNERPVSLLVVGEPARIQGLRAAFLADARIQLIATSTSAEDVRSKLALEPEAVVVEGTVFAGPEAFVQSFAAFVGVVMVLLPSGVVVSVLDTLRAVPCVHEIVQGDANFVEVVGKVYEAALLNRQARQSINGSIGSLYGGSASLLASSSGWRAVAVWSPQGGVGKSTLSVALACEAASRRLPTLLVGLGAPDPIPLTLHLKPEPNLTTWRLTPTPDNLRSSVQKLEALDILAGFRDPLALTSYKNEALEGVGSLPALAGAAAYAGYAVVIFDVSSQELAAAALSSANTVVLVTLPTLPGVLNVAEAVHLLHDQMAGRHRVPREAIHLVVNKVRNSTLTPQEVIKLGGSVRTDFPGLTAYIPDDPQIEEALKLRRPAWQMSEPLRRVSRTLADLLFATPALHTSHKEAQVGKPARVWNLGPIRIKTS